MMIDLFSQQECDDHKGRCRKEELSYRHHRSLDRFLFLFLISHSFSCYEQPFRIDSVWRTGDERHEVSSFLYLQQISILRICRLDIADPIGQRPAEYIDVEEIAFFQFI